MVLCVAAHLNRQSVPTETQVFPRRWCEGLTFGEPALGDVAKSI